MQTFDQSLFDLYERSEISYDDALRTADSVNDLRLQIKLHSQRAAPSERDLARGTEKLNVQAALDEIRGKGVLGLQLYDRNKF